MEKIQIFTFTAIRVVVNTAHRMIYPFLSIFARGLGVDVGAISTLVANRAIVGSLDPFIFPFIETRGRKFGMLLGLGLFVISMSMVVIWPTVTSLGISLILSLAGKSIFDPSLTSYLADHTPYEKRGSAIALLEFAWSLAFILGIPAAGWLIARADWSAPFSTLAILGTTGFIYIALTLKDSIKPEHHTDGIFGNAKVILTSRTTLIAISIGLTFFSAHHETSLPVAWRSR